MQVHTHKSEVVAKDINCSKFTVSQAKCSLSLPQGLDGSDGLADEDRNLLGAFSCIESSRLQVL